MTTPRLLLVATALLAAVAVYEAWQLHRAGTELVAARKNIGRQQQQLKTERARLSAAKATEGTAADHDTAQQLPPTDARAAEIAAHIARVHALQELFASRPDQRIPEMELLTDADWLRVAQQTSIDTEEDRRYAMAEMRAAAKAIFTNRLSSAVAKFKTNSGGALPTDLAQLTSFYEGTIPAGALARYRLIPQESAPKLPWSNELIEEAAPIDDAFDWYETIGRNGSSAASWPWAMSKLRDDIEQAIQSAKLRPEDAAKNPAAYLTYLHTPLARAWVAAEIDFLRAGGRGDPTPELLLPYLNDPSAQRYAKALIAGKKRR